MATATATRPKTATIHPVLAERLKEQHDYLSPEHVEHFVVGLTNRAERRYSLAARLTEDAQNIHRTESRIYLEARSTDFDSAREARDWAKLYYKGKDVERDDAAFSK